MAYPRAHQPHPGSEGLWSGTHSAISSRLLPESNRITVKICRSVCGTNSSRDEEPTSRAHHTGKGISGPLLRS